MRCLARCASLIAPGTTEDKRSPLKREDSGSTVSKLDVDMQKFLSQESLKPDFPFAATPNGNH
jgi:hypothetical protein